jgi:hypothetical protein
VRDRQRFGRGADPRAKERASESADLVPSPSA